MYIHRLSNEKADYKFQWRTRSICACNDLKNSTAATNSIDGMQGLRLKNKSVPVKPCRIIAGVSG